MTAFLKAQLKELARLQSDARTRVHKVAMDALDDVSERLRSTQLGDWDVQANRIIQAKLRDGIATLVEAQRSAVQAEVSQAVDVSVDHTAKALRHLDRKFHGTERSLSFEEPSWIARNRDQLSIVRLRQYSRSFSRYGAQAVMEIEDEIAKNILLGRKWYEARDKVWSSVRRVVGDRQWMVDRILRTEFSAAYNGARLAALLEEDSEQDPMMKKLVATFDHRTGRDSKLVHGQIRKVGEPFLDIMRGRTYMAPPNRPNDREVVVGWRASYGVYRGPEAVSVDAEAPTPLDREKFLRAELSRSIAHAAVVAQIATDDGGESNEARAAAAATEVSGLTKELKYLENLRRAEDIPLYGLSPTQLGVLLRVRSGLPVRRSMDLQDLIKKGYVTKRLSRNRARWMLGITLLGEEYLRRNLLQDPMG